MQSNYTSVRNAKSEAFRGYIEANIGEYVESVFLKLADNQQEEGDSVLSLLSNEEITLELKEAIVSNQSFVYDLADLPEDLWKYVVKERKQIVSWDNIAKYYDFEDDKELVTELLNEEDLYDELSKINTAGSNKEFVQFILKNDDLDLDAYKALLKAQKWTIHVLYGGLSHDKWIYLINRKFIQLNTSTFTASLAGDEATAALIENNYDDYAEAKTDYPLNHNVIMLLLESDLDDDDKKDLCYDIVPDGYDAESRLGSLTSEFFSQDDFDLEKIHISIIANSIEKASQEEYAIRVLCKCIPQWGETRTMNTLKAIGGDYAEIAKYGKMPKIENNEYNQTLANLLEEHHYISSTDEKGATIQINTKKSPG